MGLLSRTFEASAGRKAIADHPALHGLDPVSTYSPGASRSDAVISQREAPVHGRTYGGGGDAIDWVMDCVRLYADTTSAAEWHLERDNKPMVRKKDDGSPEGAIEGPKDLYDLLDSPNPFMDYAELMDLLVIDLLLVGNAYWYKHGITDEGKPIALYRMSPSYVKIVPGPYGPKGFEYQPPGTRNKMKLSPDKVMHYRLPNPHSAYYGLGIVSGGGRVFDMEIALTNTQASYYENNADPSVIFQSDRRVPRDVFNKLRAQLRAKTAGPNRAGEMLLLEAGLKAMTLSPSAREALFEEVTKLNRDRIFAMFRTSPMLFGIMDETSGSTKISDFRREFDTKTMRPFLDRLQKRISKGLCEPWDVDFKFDYNYIIPQEEVIKQGGELAAIPGVKVREVRGFLVRGGVLDEVSTGDKELDNIVLNEPQLEMDEDGQGGAPDQPLPGEAGRPPKGGTQAFRSAGAQGATSKTARPAGKAVGWDEIEARLEAAKALQPQEPFKLKGTMRPEDPFRQDRESAVDFAVSRMKGRIDVACQNLERSLMDHTEGTKALDAAAAKRIRNSVAWATFTDQLEDALLDGTTAAVQTAITHQGSSGRVVEVDPEETARSIILRPEGLDSIVGNLKSETLKIVEDALLADKSREEVDALIHEKIVTWYTNKSETVALTEATHAYNEGTLRVAEEVGSKVLVEDGHDHDAECAAADGQVWDPDFARKHRIEHPRCRRAFTILDAE